jgi:glutathione synthase/RimK-type ligase-like ATP-grasp enzyme
MSLYIYPYKMASKSARALRDGLSSSLGYRVKLVRPDGRFRPRRGDTVINWGNSIFPNWDWKDENDINKPFAIKAAANKYNAFTDFKTANIQTPDWTINQNEAQTWLNDGATVFVRHVLTGHSGQGIEVVSEGELPHAPLYTKYKKKRHEYRVHVWKGEVIDTQQKRKSREANNAGAVNTLIRNHSNGWVFCHNDVTPDIRRDTLAIQSVQALGLSFGGVDIIYNEHEDQYYTLEVNSAPGLEGITVNKYVQAILQQ